MLLALVISCACGPSTTQSSAGGPLGEDGLPVGGRGAAVGEEPVTPAEHDVEVPPAP